MGERPIANKYREGKMQRTLKRELKVPEIVEKETIGISACTGAGVQLEGGGLSGYYFCDLRGRGLVFW